MNKKVALLLLSIALGATVAAYVRTLPYQFVYDDTDQIVKNTAVHSWAFVPHYFASDVWPHASADEFSNYYRPVFQLWLLLNYKVFGLNPVWWHFTSLLVHLVVVSLVFLLALTLTRDELLAGGAAALFGLHPIHIEAVTWISGVTEPLTAAFFLTSLLCYFKSLRKADSNSGTDWWFIGSLGFYVVALLEKETALVLPVVIFCYRWLFSTADVNEETNPSSKRIDRQRFLIAVRSTLPYLVLTALYLVARFFALNGLGHSLMHLPLKVVVYTWPSILLFYAKSLVWPLGLSAFYDTPYVVSLSPVQFILPALILLLIAIALFYWARRSRLVAFFSLWMLLPILPLLNLAVFKDGEIAHDRYLYLPSIGFCILVAYAVRHLRLGSARIFGQPAAQVLVLLVLACLLGIATVYQSKFWASDLSLAARGVLMAPHNNMAANDFAKELGLRGNYQAAIPIFLQVIERKPSYWLPNFNIGVAYYQIGNLPKAEYYFRKAIKIYPSDAAELRFLGFTLLELGRIDEAATMLRKAISLDSSAPDQHYALGTILKQQKDFEGALKEFKVEQNINPNRPDLQRDLTETESQLTANPK